MSNGFVRCVLWTDNCTVIVRRVVEARKLHKEQQQPQKPKENPSDKMGSSTARTPALTATEKAASDAQYKDGRGHRNRLLSKSSGLMRTLSRNISSKDKQASEDQGQSFWESLRCW